MISEIRFPLILVNLKTYREASRRNALRLAVIAEEVSRKTGVCIAVAPQPLDVLKIAEVARVPIVAQHVDPVGCGQYTGHLPPEAFAEAGCAGALINHSERRIDMNIIEQTIRRVRETKMVPIVCTDSVETSRIIARFKPDAIAIEPPELIGTGTPVSKAKPEVVSGAVEAVKSINTGLKVLCGAGITGGEDVAIALELGAEGILVASGVVKSKDQYGILMEFADAVRKHVH